jgi:hypothetical protein
VDWTQISYFKITQFYSYYSANFYIDGLEWVSTGGAGGGGASDSVPYTIYMDGGDLEITGDSTIIGEGKIGGRIVNWGGTSTLQYATFDNIWHTEYPGAGNSLQCYGGVEVYGDATIDNVTSSQAGPWRTVPQEQV